MAYNKNLYTSSTSALDAGIVYDQTETKMQSEINSGLKGEVNNVKNTLIHLEDSIAYVQNGDTASRTYVEGQFVYLKNHATLTEGLYTINSGGIPSGTTVTGHLTANSTGGLNSVPFYKDTSAITVAFSNQNSKAINITNGLGIAKERIYHIDIFDLIGWGTYTPLCLYDPDTGNAAFYIQNMATLSPTCKVRAFYK